MPQRVARWVRKHRRTTAVAAFSAGVSLVLAVGGYLFWQDRQQARLARLNLTTDSPNLLAEVVDAEGRTLVPAFPVPSPEPVAVPAGAHQLRLSASGLLSETWPIEIATREHQPSPCNSTRAGCGRRARSTPPSIRKRKSSPRRDHADLLVLAFAGRKSGSGNLRRLRRWTARPANPPGPATSFLMKPPCPGGNLDEWKRCPPTGRLAHRTRDTGLADRTRDLDGDGVGDPVLLSRTTPSLVAMSGADGQVLWWARVRPRFDGAALGQAPRTTSKLDRSGRGFVVGLPAMADLDADGVPDFVGCFQLESDTYVAPDRARHRTGAQSSLAAVSGKTGAVLWQRPVALNWSQYVNTSTAAEKHHALCRPVLGPGQRPRRGRVGGEVHLLGFDARSGEPAWLPITRI